MGGMKLDGAGAQKMKTLEEAHLTLSRINAMIERAAVDVKNKKPIGAVPLQIRNESSDGKQFTKRRLARLRAPSSGTGTGVMATSTTWR